MLYDIIKSEHSMTDSALNRDPDSIVRKVCHLGEANTYIVDTTGASVTTNSSVSLIYKYCEKLPGDMYKSSISLSLSLFSCL